MLKLLIFFFFLQVNGFMTLSESMADEVGLKFSYLVGIFSFTLRLKT